MNKEHIGLLIDRKKEALPDRVIVFGPEDNLAAQVQADWLTTLLCQVYVQHGITKNREKLIADIDAGICKLWFAAKDGKPISSAAVIKQTDGSVEIGRAVSLVKGVGSFLRFLAIADHLATSSGPVVSEVRIADQFAGIPSGEATQTVCFKHLGLIPQALVPAFCHGDPVRQEMFLFSSSEKIRAEEPIILPNDRASLDLVVKTAMAVASEALGNEQIIKTDGGSKQITKWSLVRSDPFCLMIPSDNGSQFETVLGEAYKNAPFTMIPLGTGPGHSSALIECLNLGFIPCGFDRNLGGDGYPVLLLGKLREGTLLAPIKLVSGLFGIRVVAGINNINRQFRSQLLSTIY